MVWNPNQRTILRNSTIWSAYDALTSTFIIAFALALGASNLWVGILGAVPYIAMMASQIPGAYSIQYVTRKSIYLVTTGTSRLLWALLILAPVLFEKNVLAFVCLGYFVCKLLETFADPAWTTMLADIVPQKIRGRFVADRNILMGITGAIAYLLGGLVLDHFDKTSLTGFMILFGLGSLIGLAATFSMRKLDEPRSHQHEHYHMKEFFTMEGDFAKFCTFVFWFHFGWMIVSPFFTVYMLKNLGISYSYFVVVMAVSTLARVLSHRSLGSLADRLGDKFLMSIVTLGVGIVPAIFYFATPENTWILVPIHIFTGIAWAGFDIAMLNLMIDFSDGKSAPVRIAEIQMVSALAVIISPILGGWIADSAIFFISGIPLVFLISAVIRTSSIFFIMRLPEPRVKGKTTDIFHEVIAFRPVEGVIHHTRNVQRRIKAFMLK